MNFSIDLWVNGSNYAPLGETEVGNDYVVVTGTPTIPTAARVNDTAPLYTANRYATSTKAVLLGTRTVSYVVEADTASTALITLIQETKDTSNVTTGRFTQQLRITPNGTFTRIKETAVEGTKTNFTLTY